jgi:type II secretory pathway pseudopilin PulG
MSASIALSTSVQAQETNDVEILRTQLRALQESFERAQREHREQLEKLNQRIDSLLKQQATDAEAKKLEAELSRELGNPPPSTNAVSTASSDTRRAWSPADPIRIQSGGSYLDLGLVSTFALGSSTADDIQGGTQLGGHDPNQRGFTMQGLELSLSGAVDPYFRGNANILFQVDADGESNVEVEEAWLETISLPANLQLRAGQVLTDFGRQNPTHPHSWAFVDTPLVLGRFFGADGLRNPGTRLSWLAPTPFYSELSFMVQNSHGETASSFRSAGDSHAADDELPLAYRHPENDRGVSHIDDLLFTPRYAASFDITDTQVLLLGASAAFGPNASGGEDAGNTRTEIYGVDLTWKWRSAKQSGGFPFVSIQTEGLLRRYDAGAFDWNTATEEGDVVEDASGQPAVLSGETLLDYGFYAQVLYGFRKGWVAGLRFDYVDSDAADYERAGYTYNGETLGRDPQRAERWRLSPNLTWYPTEYSKIRLQYNYDDRQEEGVDHSVWLQFEFLLGAHAAHKF